MNEQPLQDVNDAAPQVIDHFIGQKGVIEQVKVALEASWNDGVRFPHALMVGGAGLGKSEICKLIAKETAGELFEQLAQNISSIEQMRGLLMEPKDKDVLFIDEIHELNPSVQNDLV